MLVFKLLLIAAAALALVHAESSRSGGPLVLKDVLPAKYDMMEPPKHDDKPAYVKFHVTVINMDSFDESSMTYKCDIFLAQSWKDRRLLLPPGVSKNGTYRQLPVKWLDKIWKPDTFFKNAKKVDFDEKTIPNHYIWLWNDNTILWTAKYSLEMTCPMNFETYPHDKQTCSMTLESLSHTTADVVFEWEEIKPVRIHKSIQTPELTLSKTTWTGGATPYLVGHFSFIEVDFVMKRRLGRFLLQTYIPTIVIVMVSWLSFWMKPENDTERIMLGVTSLLTIFAQHAISLQSLPPISYLKAIDVFMNMCTFFVFLSIVEFVIVSKILSWYDRPRRKKYLNSIENSEAEAQQLKESSSDGLDQHKVVFGLVTMPKTKDDAFHVALRIDQLCRFIIPALFILLNAIYWGVYTAD